MAEISVSADPVFAELVTVSGARRAALYLHSLQASDRAWILERLPSDHRADVLAMLEELKTAQVAADVATQWFTADEQLRSSAPAATEHDAAAALLMQLSTEQVARLSRRLACLPAPVLARYLLLRPWPWRAALLAQLPQPLGAQVQGLLGSVSVPPAGPLLAMAMLRTMLRDLESELRSKTGVRRSAASLPSRWRRSMDGVVSFWRRR